MNDSRYQGTLDDQPTYFETSDGLKLRTRLLRADDAARLIDMFEHLSPETRRHRFHAGANNLSDKVKQRTARMLANVDNRTQGGAVLALIEEDGEEAIVGVARFGRPLGRPDDPVAEAAITVRDDFHGRGIGTELLRRLVLLSKVMQVETMLAEFEADNHRAIKLFRDLGLPTKTSASQGEVALRIEMPRE